MDRSRAIELQRRGLASFVRLLASGSDSSALFERDGVLGAVVPVCADRSVLNSVAYRATESLAAALEDLAAAQEAAGVRAWTVWVPEEDRDAAVLLEAAGHRLDATPMGMSLELARLTDPETKELDWDDRAVTADVGRINDLAYGYPVPTFGNAIIDLPPDLPLRFYQARVDGEPASVVGTFDDGDDCGVYFVATLKEHRGKGLARRLMHVALTEARERGLRTSTLQATKLGYPVYELLGYQPVCALQMWERREPGSA